MSTLVTERTANMRAPRAEMDGLNSEAVRNYRSAFRKGLRFDFDNAYALNEDERALIASMQTVRTEVERRDMQIGVLGGAYQNAPITGGFFVPLEMAESITSAMKDVGPMFRLATVIDTASGALRAFPEEDDATITGERIVEGEQSTMSDVADIHQVMLSSYQYTSRIIRISTSLAQDFGFDIESYLAQRFATRVARIANADFTTGTGSSQPRGFLTAASSAGTAIGAASNDGSSGPNTIGVDDCSALEQSVDPEYRRNGTWMLHPNTLAALRKVKDKQGLPVFPGLHSGGEDTIFNRPIALNPHMAQLQSVASSPVVSNITLAFGDFSKYIIRRAPPILVMLKQRFIDVGQYAYILWWRMDGSLIDGGGGAIKTLTNTY